MTNLTVNPITANAGAELSGGRIVDADPKWLTTQLDQHLVLVARDQFLSHSEQVELARLIGDPTPAHPVVPGHPDHPEILELNGAQGGRNARWHTDVTFVEAPPAASVLVGDAFPESGGDTLWADLRTAYERLSDPVRQLVEDLRAVHRISPLAYWGEPFDTAMSRDDAADLYEKSTKVRPVIHPVVRVHPSTQRRSLFVNPGFTSHITGLSRVESDALLQMLYAHSTQPELIVRHRWRPGDVVIWDNRATMHYASDDYGSAERRMRRVTLAGGTPIGPNGFKSVTPKDPLLTVR